MLRLEHHFPLNKHDLEKILEVGLSLGGDFADIFMEYRHYQAVAMEEDLVKETNEGFIQGIGVRVISGEKTGYAYTNELSLEEAKKAALVAANIARHGQPRACCRLVAKKIDTDAYPLTISPDKMELRQKIELVKQAYRACQSFDRKIIRIKAGLGDVVQFVAIANSEGLYVTDARPMVRLNCLAIAEEKNRREVGYAGAGGRVGYDYFDSVTRPEDIGKEAAIEALKLLEAVEAPAGEMPVVLAPGHSGVLVHEAVGHLLEADFIRKKTSVFWNKKGQKVGSPLVRIIDDPTIPSFRGSYNIDDEGTSPHPTLLIDKGIVMNFLQDRLSAKLMRLPLTGHGRRQDFTCFPLPRMANTFIDRGETPPEEIIHSVKKGIYAARFEGGQVEDSGKFTFTISSGYLIEEGRLTAPLKQATLIGMNLDILENIVMVGTDLAFSPQTGTCSKEGQEVPVSDGCPTIKIVRMTVGGQL
ncbi:MAG: TldD/PmbA family protein [Candidatus Aminicenantales bacterium]